MGTFSKSWGYFHLILLSISFLSFPDYMRSKPIKPVKIPNNIELSDANIGPNFVNILSVKLGEPFQQLSLKISTSFCGLYVLDKITFNRGYSLNQSSTGKKVSEKGQLNDMSGEIIADFLKISQNPSLLISFLLIRSLKAQFTDYDGAIGIGTNCNSPYNIEKKQYSFDLLSIIQKIYENSHQVFSLTIDSNGITILDLGNYPFKIQTLSKSFYYKRIPLSINPRTNSWEVKLAGVYLENNSFLKVNQNIAIGTSGAFIAVDQQFFSFFIWNFFLNHDSELSFNNNCFQTNGNYVQEIYCNENYDISQIGTISLVIGKHTIKIESDKLFYEVKRNGRLQRFFSIVHYPTNDKWYISQKLIYDATVVYDNKRKEIGLLYSRFADKIYHGLKE